MGGAIAHYRKVRERGDVLIPASSREALNELRKQWAPAMAFADACLKIGAGLSVPKSLVYLTYKTWCHANGHKHPLTAGDFGAALRQAIPSMGESYPRVGGSKRQEHYTGIALHEDAPKLGLF